MSRIVRSHKSTSKSSTLVRFFRRKAKNKLYEAASILPFLNRIRDMENEINLLTTYSSDTVYRLNYDNMSYSYISPAIKSLLGYSPIEMMQINFRSLILETRLITDGIHQIHSFDELEKKRRTGDVNKWQADYLMKTKNGETKWVSDISCPWINEKGVIIGSVGCLRDISDRIKAENNRNEELIRLAHTDPLTNLANRREFFNRTEVELKRIQRSRSELSLLIIDIDHFKKINDTYGHDIGDKVLIEMTDIFKACLRQTDLAARLGGEEFGIFLPDTSSEGAYWVAERICQMVAKHKFYVLEGGLSLSCTVSIGVSSTSLSETSDTAGLYKMADTRLYIAKNTGRNQVSMDEIVRLH